MSQDTIESLRARVAELEAEETHLDGCVANNLTVSRRKRYITDEEYIAIRSKAHPVLRAAMDISYVTGARIGDILDIRIAHITAEGLLIRQGKVLEAATQTLIGQIREKTGNPFFFGEPFLQ